MFFFKLGRTPVLTFGRIGVLMMFALVATVFFNATSSASLDKNKASRSPMAVESAGPQGTVIAPSRFGTLSSFLMPQAPPPPESLGTYDATCTTPTTTFNLGETVCLKTTGVPVGSPATRSVTWSNPVSAETQRTDLVSSPDDTFMLPAMQTSVVNGEVVDNRGNWTVKVVLTGRSKVRAAATFTVKDTDNPVVDMIFTTV